MLRLASPDGVRLASSRTLDATFGGGEANVAISLARLGLDAAFVTALPDNDLGDAARHFLAGHGVDVAGVTTRPGRLGIYFLEPGAAQRPSRVLYDRAESSFTQSGPGDFAWEFAARRRHLVPHDGHHARAVRHRPPRRPIAGARAARAAGATVSVDLNYRAKLWKWGRPAGDVMADLVAEADVLIGNEEDADKVFGIRAAGTSVSDGHVESAGYADVAEQLASRFPRLRTVAFTQRGSISASENTWSGVLWTPDTFVVARTWRIAPIVDRVGAGDAFAAGLIAALTDGAEPEGCDRVRGGGRVPQALPARRREPRLACRGRGACRRQRGRAGRAMSISRRREVLDAIGDSGVLPLFYCDDVEQSVRIMAALAEGGARAIEFTDRGPRCPPRLRRDGRAGRRRRPADILLGAGSIRDPYAADWFIAAGARFIVGPTFDPDVATLCNLRRVPYLPGCATPTEIVTAEKSGVEFVKVFPGDVLGPAFVRAIRGPLPEAQVVVTGGVAATEASVRDWISAGAAALGFGSGLVSKAVTSGADPAPLTHTMADLIRWVALVRSEQDPSMRQASLRSSPPRSPSHDHRHRHPHLREPDRRPMGRCAGRGNVRTPEPGA